VEKVETEKKGWLGKLFGGKKKKEEGGEGSETKEEAQKEEAKT